MDICNEQHPCMSHVSGGCSALSPLVLSGALRTSGAGTAVPTGPGKQTKVEMHVQQGFPLIGCGGFFHSKDPGLIQTPGV